MKNTKNRIVPLVVEELEPRILYSADAAVLLHPDALTPQAETRSMDFYTAPAANDGAGAVLPREDSAAPAANTGITADPAAPATDGTPTAPQPITPPLQFKAASGDLVGFTDTSVIVASPERMLRIDLEGANAVAPVSRDASAGDAATGAAPKFSEVTFRGIWNGVTLEYTAAAEGIFESTYLIEGGQGGNPVDQIRLDYSREVTVDARGNLVIALDHGFMTDSAPVAWQDIGGQRHYVDVSYRLFDDNDVGFVVGDYDHSQALVIDPTLTWSTFLGAGASNQNDYAQSIAVDGSGNVYVAGMSNATWGSPVRAFNGGSYDAFLAKLDSSGSLVWNTFLGGTGGDDQAYGVAVDGSGNAYVSGMSAATWGSPVRAYGGGSTDAFVAKVSSTGTVTWNTFLGSSTSSEYGNAVAVDASGNVYVAGTAYSAATWGSPVRATSGGDEAFVAKLNSSGALTWNTFLGGSGSDYGQGIAVDGSGNVYVAGRGDATWGTPVRAYTGGFDGVAVKLNSGGALTWNTFLGGAGWDQANAISLDASGNVYVAGYNTASWGTPVHAFSGASANASAVKLTNAGALAWSTFYAFSAAGDGANGIAVDGSGNVYLAVDNGSDAVAARLDAGGNFVWSQALGGAGADTANGVAVDATGNVYVAGESTAAWGSPVRPYGASYDAYVARIGGGPAIDLDADDSSGAPGADFTTRFQGSGAVTVADSDAAISDPQSANLVSLTVTLTNPLDGAAEVLAANTAGTSITASYNSGSGILTLSGSDTLAHYGQVLRTVTYNNTAGSPNTTERTITFVASDGTNTSGTATTRVKLANQAPVNSVPGTQTADYVGTVVFSSANGNAISISDPDAGTAAVQVTLTATQGTLSLAGTTGLTFSTGDGTADASMTFTGTIASINAALNGLTFNGDPFRASGTGSVQIVTNDLGNTGMDGAKSDTDTVTVDMVPLGTPYMITGTYAGTNGTLSITGLGFQPDVVIVKETSSNKVAVIKTSTMPGAASKVMTGAFATSTTDITSLDVDGFTVANGGNVNVGGQQFTFIAFKASSGVMSVGSYTGTGTAGKTVTGLGFSPELVFLLDKSNQSAIFQSSMDGNTYDFSKTPIASGTGVTSLDSDGFTLGTASAANKLNDTYYYVAWNRIQGSMNLGTYTGNATDDRNITGVGFQPEWLMLQGNSASNPEVYNKTDAQGASTDIFNTFDGNASTNNGIQRLQSDGFQLGTDTGVNKSGISYQYMAWRQETGPTISAISSQTTPEDTALGPIGFTIGDSETAAGNLSVKATSSDQSLVANASFTFGGSGASRTLTLTPVANANGTVTVTVYVSDGQAVSSTTFTLTITAVNDAPVSSGANNFTTITEDQTANSGDLVSTLISGKVSDVDAGAVNGIAVTGLASGTGTWQYSIDNGSTWANVGAVANNAALLLRSTDKLRFVPDGQNGTSASVTFRDWDQTSGTQGTKVDTTTNGGTTAFSTATATSNITVTSVNDAPTIANSATVTLPGTTEDTTSSATTVSSILTSASWADVDTGALKGIAVTSTAGNGTWQYSTDGVTWTAFGAVSSSNALLLDSASQVRYLPDGVNGETATFGFAAWDQTTGSASANGAPSRANPGAGGGTTAYSSQSATASTTVTSVNDAPVLSGANNFTTITEDQITNSGDLVSTLISGKVSDVDTGAVNGIAVTSLASSTGIWQYSIDGGSTWINVGAVANNLALLLRSIDKLRFVPDGQNGTSASVTFRAWDQTSGTQGTKVDTTTNGGTTAFSTATATSNITVTSVNDAPTITNGTTVVLTGTNEDTPSSGTMVSIILTSAAWADVDTGAVKGIAITGKAGNGTWQYSTDGVTWTAFGAVSSSNALLLDSASQVRYIPDGANGETGTFGFVAWDRTTGSASANGAPSYANPGAGGGTTAYSSQSATASMTITLVNDAPTIANGATVTLTGTNEDTASSGTAVSSILTSVSWADVDIGAVKGIAITSKTGNGSWQYSTDGVTWTAFGAVSSSNALLLASGSQVRYVPDSANGETATFGFKAWDQTIGTASTNATPGYANPGAGGGSSAYSSQSATASMTVTSVNDAPVLSGANNFTTIAEDQTTNSGDLVSTLISGKVSDVDTGAVNGIAVTSLASSTGTWQYSTDNGSTWTNVGTVANNSALLLRSIDKLRFVPDGQNATSASVTFRAWDRTSGTQGTQVDTTANGGTTAFSTATASSNITVTSINDAPTITNSATVTLTGTTEDTPSSGTTVSSILTSASWADTDTGAVKGIAITSTAGNGTWQYSTDGVTWSAFGAVSSSNALLLDSGSQVRYLPDAQNGETATFGFVAWDQTTGTASTNATPGHANPGAGGGSTAYSSQSATASMTITSVNDAPTITSGATVLLTGTDENTTSSGTTVTSILTSASWADVDTGAVKGIAITSNSGNGTWQYSTDGVTWNGFGAVSSANALLLTAGSQVRYIPDGANSETATFGFKAWDQTTGTASTNATPGYANPGAGGGTTAYSSQSATASMTVSSVNDAPVLSGANNLTTILEDPSSNTGTLVSSLISGKLTDADAPSMQGIAVIAVDNTNGTWQYSTNGGSSWNNFGSPSAAAARLLGADTNAYVRFVPNANWNGTVAGGITFRAWDQASGAEGGTADATANGGTTAFSTATASSGITVTPVNDAPAGADKTVTVLEDGTYTFTAVDFGFTDPSDAAGPSGANALAAVKITTAPGAGSLTLSGAAVTAGELVSAASIAAGNLKFTPGANATGAGYASFTFQVEDDGGTANGGVDLDQSANTITINVTAVNDAPVNSVPGAQSVAEDGTLVFSSGNGNLISISDVDAGGSALQVTLTGTNGTITLSGTTGLTFSAGDGAGDATMTFTGTAAAINAALSGMSFAPTPDYAGAASLQIVTNDQGNTGSGGAQSDTDTVAITVTADNDPPVITSNGGGATASIDVAENTTVVTTVTATDPEAPGVETLVYSIIGGADATRFAINGTTGVLTFIVAPDYDVPGDANADNVYDVTVRVTDGTLTDSQAISVTVTAVNDSAPVITSDGGGATASVNVAENTTAVTTVAASDADLPAQGLVYSIVGGADAAKFTINVITGELSLLAAPNYESPTDANTDNVYHVTVQVSDGTFTDTQAIAVTVTPVNDNAPVITSDGGGATASVNAAENTTAVTTVTATDADLPAQSHTYSIVGGADAAKFSINATTGALAFLAAPNYEIPADTDLDNVYQVTVQVSDGSLTDTQAISVTVTAVNDNAPVITSDGGGATASVNVAENATAITTATATDADLPAQSLTYAIVGGADAAKFTIDGSTGALTFIVAPDAEAPGDANADNVYEVTVQVSDGILADTQAISVHVTDVDEFDVGAVTDTNAAVNQVSENASVGDAVGITASASDADATTHNITFSLDDDAGGRFAIDAASGVVTVAGALDYETDTSHTITVRATSADGSFSTQNFVIDVLDANEAGVGPLSDTDAAANAVLENAANGTTVGIVAFASDPDASDLVTYGLDDDAGGRFAIDTNTGVVTVADGTLLDRESAASYRITVRATSDDASVVTRDFTINIGDEDEFNVGAVTDANGDANQVAENATNGTLVGLTAFASDPDATTSAITYSLDDDAGGRFAIDGATGAVTVADGSLLDRESAASHTITVRASSQDGSSSTQNFVIAVAAVNDNAPVVTSDGGGATASVNVAENATAVTTVTATDADLPAQSLTYSIVGGADAAKFTIDAVTGALSFVSAQDFEVPADADLDNVYQVTVQVSDGSLTDTQAIAVAVTAVDDNAPVITSDGGGATASVNVPENATAVTTVTATDADLPAQSLTYSIVGGADAARFTIDAVTGALSFVSAQNFEVPADANLDNVYQVTVRVSDGSFTDTQAIEVTVTAVNDNAPIITSDGGGATASVNVAENTAAVTTITATDADLPVQSLTYSIIGGADAGSFTIDAVTGALSFVSAPNFEVPVDADLDNVYQVTVRVSDGSLTDTQAIAVTVTAANDNAPVITSDGGGATASVNVAENATAVTTVTATDADLPVQSLTYSIVGGADAAKFTIDAVTGALRFVAAPNFEVPVDADLDNIYQVNVQVSDGTLIDNQAIAVTVTTVNDNAPVITSDGGGTTASVNVAENATAVTTVTATDADLPAQSLTYSIVGGADAAKFTIDAVSGVLSFVSARNFEVPANADLDNVYQVTVRVSDGSLTDTQAISVTVTPVNDNAPVITSDGGGTTASVSVAETTTAVTTVTATDADLPVQSLTYSIVGGADAAKFTIDAASGALFFVAAPDFEVPGDADLDNVYQVIVQVSDGTANDTQAIAVTVTAVNDNAPVITSDGGGATASVNVAENATAVTTVTATDADLPAQSLTYSIAGGADAAKFTIDAITGALGFAAAPDFEVPADADLDNIYQVTVQVSDGILTGTQAIAVTVTAVNENAPVITSDGGGATASVNVAENATAVTTVTATDADLPAQSLTYSIVGGADAARFTIDAVTGALNFVAAPNFEVPTDADLDNVYQVTVRVSDGTLTDTQAISVTVTAANDNAPVITSDGGGVTALVSVAENTTAVATVGATDADLPARTLTYSIVGGADAARFTIDAVTGALSFVSAPNFEVPADADLDNVYQVTVQVSDGSLTDTQAISVTVTAVNDNAPVITSDGGGATASVNVAENATAVTTVTATDADLPAQSFTYAIVGGADAAKFTIDGSTGALTFIVAPDAEAPGNTNADNVYEVTVRVSDGVLADTQAISVHVTDLDEFDVGAVTDTNAAANHVSENAALGDAVGITAAAADADATTNHISFSLDDNAGGRFAIDAASGVVTVAGALDYETGTSHTITVRATSADGSFSTQNFVIDVLDANEAAVGPISDTDGAANTVLENAANGTLVGLTAFASDPDATTSAITYSLDDNAGGRFAIDGATGAVTVADGSLLDRESAASHTITVRASSQDGSSSTQNFVIAVAAVNDNAPVITSDGGGASAAVNVAENSTAVTTVSATDADLPAQSLTYSIVGGADAARFTIDAVTGALRFIAAPDFEGPMDADLDNIYQVTVQVSDGTLADTQTIAVTIIGTDDVPVLNSAALALNEGETVSLSGANFGIIDLDSASFTYTASGVTGGYFQLTSAPGTAVTTFTSADLAGNRVQFVDDGNETAPAFSVTVNDGTSSSNTLAATISYNPVNDAPVVTGATLAVTEGAAATLSTASIGVTDPDNASFTYTVSGVSNGYFQLTSAPGSAVTTFTSAEIAGNRVQFVHDGSEAAPTFSVRVSDGTASSNTLAATIAYTTANDAPSGAPSVAGQLTSGQTLAASTAAIADPDGLGSLAFQWERSGDSGATWTGIAGSTASTYTLGASDIGNVVRVAVSYTDGQGTTERLASGATGAIMGASTSQAAKAGPPPPPAPAAPVTQAVPAQQEQAPAANPGDARTAQQVVVGGRAGTPGARPGADSVDAAAQPVIVRTGALAAPGATATAAAASAGDPDIGRYQKAMVGRGSDSVTPALLLRIETGAQPVAAVQSEFLGVANGTRLEPSVAAIASEASNGEEAAPERATIMTAETSVKLSGAVVSAGFVIWALRGVGLLTTLLSSIPAWRHIDPVPILAPEEDKPDWDESDDQESARDERAMSSVFANTDGGTDRRTS